MIFGFRNRFWLENLRNRTYNLRWALQKVIFGLLNRNFKTSKLSRCAPLRWIFFIDFEDLKSQIQRSQDPRIVNSVLLRSPCRTQQSLFDLLSQGESSAGRASGGRRPGIPGALWDQETHHWCRATFWWSGWQCEIRKRIIDASVWFGIFSIPPFCTDPLEIANSK